MVPRLIVAGVGDVRERLMRIAGKAKTEEVLGESVKAGALVYGESIQDAMPRGKSTTKRKKGVLGKLRASIKKGVKGRTTPTGPMYFSAVDRRLAPQGKWLHLGTKHQKARPEIFIGAIGRARAQARAAVRAKLAQIDWNSL